MNEETFIESGTPTVVRKANNEMNKEAWKHVTLGGVSGILLGAGLVYAGHAMAQSVMQEDLDDEELLDDEEIEEQEELDSEEDVQQNGQAGSTSNSNISEEVQVAEVNDNMSFGEAFAAARAQVGPGGVFCWHGGVYGTYYADEWNAMTAAEKHEYVMRVQPEVSARQVTTPTDAHPDVAVHHQAQAEQEDVVLVSDIDEQQIAENFDVGDDVHIVGYANAEGHLVVGYDTTGDGEADVAIIDVDDSHSISDPDIIMDREGNAEAIGDLNNEPDLNQQASLENPDVAPDMPDYMNDAIA